MFKSLFFRFIKKIPLSIISKNVNLKKKERFNMKYRETLDIKIKSNIKIIKKQWESADIDAPRKCVL